MNYLKLFLELTVLIMLFLLLRQSVHILFPRLGKLNKSGRPQPLRSFLFILFGLMSSLLYFWAFYGLIYFVHNYGSNDSVLVISQGALIVPALIFGFYTSTHITAYLYREFFIQERLSVRMLEEASRESMTFRRIFSTFTLVPGVLLLAFQFNVYVKTDGVKIYKKELGKQEEVYELSQVKRITPLASDGVMIHLADGEEISTGGYSGNINYFLDHISH